MGVLRPFEKVLYYYFPVVDLVDIVVLGRWGGGKVDFVTMNVVLQSLSSRVVLRGSFEILYILYILYYVDSFGIFIDLHSDGRCCGDRRDRVFNYFLRESDVFG